MPKRYLVKCPYHSTHKCAHTTPCCDCKSFLAYIKETRHTVRRKTAPCRFNGPNCPHDVCLGKKGCIDFAKHDVPPTVRQVWIKGSEIIVIGEPTFVGKIMPSRELTTEIPLCICGSGKPACIKLWNENGRRCCFSCAPKKDAPTDTKEVT